MNTNRSLDSLNQLPRLQLTKVPSESLSSEMNIKCGMGKWSLFETGRCRDPILYQYCRKRYLFTMKSRYLIAFAQSHSDFRLPELQSISELHGFQVFSPEDPDTSRPFMVVELEEEEHAFILAQRCILIKWILSPYIGPSSWCDIYFGRSIYEFYARGETYDQVHSMNLSNKHLWEKYIPDTSFKFNVTGFNHTIPQRRQRDVIESFSYMDFRGRIDMKNPEITIACFEECKCINHIHCCLRS